jgi:hypothetical protein
LKFSQLGLQLRLGLLALGDVPDGGDQVIAIQADIADADFHRESGAILAPVASLHDFGAKLTDFCNFPVPGGGIHRDGLDFWHAHGQQFFAGVAKPAAGGFINVQEPARDRVYDFDAVVGLVNQGAKQVQGGLGLFEFGHVNLYALGPGDLAIGAEDGGFNDVNVSLAAAGRGMGFLH